VSDEAASVKSERVEPAWFGACLVLAAGQGRRMGGPKALLVWTDGRPLALSHAHARLRDCGRVVIVARRDTVERLRRAAPERVECVASEEPDELGPAGSIAAAVRAGALDGTGVALVTPVDVPPAGGETVRLLGGAMQAGAWAARPRHAGRFGHPVACSEQLLASRYAREARPLREVLADTGGRCAAVDVDDAGVLADLDTPERVVAATGSGPRFWG
jgi:CTP:molybdopterin cytidylyltransferase MocA